MSYPPGEHWPSTEDYGPEEAYGRARRRRRRGRGPEDLEDYGQEEGYGSAEGDEPTEGNEPVEGYGSPRRRRRRGRRGPDELEDYLAGLEEVAQLRRELKQLRAGGEAQP
ncbi:MAG: hypothetical protein ABR500_14305 [Dermatophilaceae bacterium]|nr:hypothetical protein [Intrasporangiaceae bacterium]